MENTKNTKKAVKPVPEGLHTVTPYLVCDNAAALIQFIENAFNGKKSFEMKRDDNRIMHATVSIGDSTIMISDTMEGVNAVTGMLYLYLDNVDEVYAKAIKAKAAKVREPQTEFYGDRAGAVRDEWGNIWWIATHVEDVDEKELERRAKAVQKERKDEVHA